jgi:chromatin segregation and condensation protein Rec8/ScpA/Scc1 (kleisin family)
VKAKAQGESPERPQPEYIEGPEAFQRFDAMMTALVAVPRFVLEKREKTYRKKVDANPNRRGPKRKS